MVYSNLGTSGGAANFFFTWVIEGTTGSIQNTFASEADHSASIKLKILHSCSIFVHLFETVSTIYLGCASGSVVESLTCSESCRVSCTQEAVAPFQQARKLVDWKVES